MINDIQKKGKNKGIIFAHLSICTCILKAQMMEGGERDGYKGFPQGETILCGNFLALLMMCKRTCDTTVCPRSLDQFHMVIYIESAGRCW